MVFLFILVIAIIAYFFITSGKNNNSVNNTADDDSSKIDVSAVINAAISEIEKFLNKDDYLYEFDTKKIKKEKKLLYSKIDKDTYLINKASKTKALSLKALLDKFDDSVKIHNAFWLHNNIELAYNIIGNVENQKLDLQQMESIVKNPHNQLVIAGAGTGKTTTIIGKVKYLLLKEQINPNDILILSYTHAAASEMAERLEKETHIHIDVSTFHKLGLNIITIADKKKPTIYSGQEEGKSQNYISMAMNACMCDKSFKSNLLSHILYGNIENDQEFKTEAEYEKFIKSNPPVTIRGEHVKSFGELMIANFLAQNDIDYIYEAKYEHNTADLDHRQYKPDFYLPDYKIYIEYFGIDRKGQVAPFLKGKNGKSASQVYNEGIEWKRKIHKEYGTILVECYSYEQFENILLEKLEKKLSAHNVLLNPLDYEAVIKKTNTDLLKIKETAKTEISTVINLAKGRGLAPEGLVKYTKDNCPTQYFLGVCASKVLEWYQNKLNEEKEIDFADMLNLATKYVEESRYVHSYKFVIIDEYQDLIRGQFRLLDAMRKQHDFKLFAVGDDWQSIYRFSGSDINYILDFSKYWGDSEISRIEKTYRFSQNLVDVSGGFVMSNPRQHKKQILSGTLNITDACNEFVADTEEILFSQMVDNIRELPKNSSVFFLGRYNWDRNNLLQSDNRLALKYNTAEQKSEIKIAGRPDLNAVFYTAHKSKGLQADYVYLINVKDDKYGFPSRVASSKLIEALLEKGDNYPFSEERRLFYVAMTRARKKLYLLNFKGKTSTFVTELEEKFPDKIIKKKGKVCPVCGGILIRKTGRHGPFYGCENFSKTGCKYTES